MSSTGGTHEFHYWNSAVPLVELETPYGNYVHYDNSFPFLTLITIITIIGIIHPIMFITIIGFHRIFMAIDVLTKKQNFFKNTTHYTNFAHWLILYPVYEEKE